MDTEIHLLVITPTESEFIAIQSMLEPCAQYVCHWRPRLGGVEQQVNSGDYHLVLLQFHWQYKTSQMLLHRLKNQSEPKPVVVYTEFLELDIDHHIISSGAADYFALETSNTEHLDRTLRYAVVRHAHEQRLSHLAYYDSLCGIGNRQLFADRIQQTINFHTRNRSRFALLYIDLDHFKNVNDRYGHAAGDETLVACAKRLRGSIRKSDSLARMGGDEFVVLVDSVDQEAGLAALATKIIASLRAPVSISVGDVQLGCSVGIAVFPDSADNAKSLIHNADTALYQAKEGGGNDFVIYRPNTSMPVGHDDLSQIDLLRAIKREEFCIRYQPRVDLSSGRIVAVEALMRWSHPDRGLLSPSKFFGLANDHGMLPTLSYWVIQESIRQWANLNQELDQNIGLSINITGAMLREVKLLDRLRLAVQQSHLGTLAGLELEVSATDWQQYSHVVAGLSTALEPMAVKLAIDNIGNSPLTFTDLNQDSVQSLVIDRDLIAKAEQDPSAARSVQALAAVGQIMAKTVVAQGVENLQQLRLLESYGCTSVQGYFTSSPLALTELRTRLLQQKMGRLSMLS